MILVMYKLHCGILYLYGGRFISATILAQFWSKTVRGLLLGIQRNFALAVLVRDALVVMLLIL